MNSTEFNQFLKQQKQDNTILMLHELQTRMILEDVKRVKIEFMEYGDIIVPHNFVVTSKEQAVSVDQFGEDFAYLLASQAADCDDSYIVTQSRIKITSFGIQTVIDRAVNQNSQPV